jgi:hypothetical protein
VGAEDGEELGIEEGDAAEGEGEGVVGAEEGAEPEEPFEAKLTTGGPGKVYVNPGL